MEQVKVKMSEKCEQMYNTLLKGCGLTREDINKMNFDNAEELMYNSYDNSTRVNFTIECYIECLIDLMSSIDYKFIHCSTDVLAQLNVYYALPNEECQQLIPKCDVCDNLQMVFGDEEHFGYDDTANLLVFEVRTHACPSYYIERIIFIEKGANTILFDEENGFNNIQVLPTEEQTAPTQQQSNSTNNEDLETRVNNIEEKLDTLIKMLSK